MALATALAASFAVTTLAESQRPTRPPPDSARADSARQDSVRRDSTATPRAPRTDTTLVQGGVYNRPFIASVGRTSIGGYVEGNASYFVEDGLSDGLSMELRRFNIFLYAPVGQRLRFLAELEFEHGTEEINLETALLDFQFDPAFVLRAGILLPPIGAFNTNHDSPRWDFVDRPLVSTTIIPATLSEVGGGAYGRLFPARGVTVTYDAYVTNGLGDEVVLNAEGRTWLPAGKREEQFAGDNNGSPALSGRVAVQQRRLGELGVSYYGGIYNSFRREGEVVDEKRRLSLAALDLTTAVGPVNVRGEAALATVDVPDDLEELHGERQWGAHLDVVAPVWRPRVLGLTNAVVNVGVRLEHVDYNVGRFRSTGRRIYDEVTAVVPAVSFRPVPGTVFRVNYRRHWTRDLVGNPTVVLGGFELGLATYF
jgi:hypothetical protein